MASSARDLEVWRLKKGGLGTSEIGRRMGISKQLAHLAFKRTEFLLQNDNLGLSLSKRARKAIEFLTETKNPSIPDLRRSMMELNKKESWSAHLLSVRGHGTQTVKEIIRFARESGIEEEIISPPKTPEKKWERGEEPKPDGKRVSDSHALAVKLSPRAVSALESVLGDYPTLPDMRVLLEENPRWREDLLALRNCGKRTITEIEGFAKENGMKS